MRRLTRVTEYARLAAAFVVVAMLVGGEGSALAQDTSPSPNAGFPEFTPLQPLPDATARDDSLLGVVATTPIIADLVRQVGGQRVAVDSILPNNADPHDLNLALKTSLRLRMRLSSSPMVCTSTNGQRI